MWATLLVIGFGAVGWGIGSARTPAGEEANLWSQVYLSGTTLFTLGLGDLAPDSTVSRILVVIEAGFGLGFLALVITYLPVIAQAFSRREVSVSLLDARAGSPPSAGEFFRRLDGAAHMETLLTLLDGWERWSAELLESHLSYPVLALYRSQHERQSWLAALTVILDITSLILAGDNEEAKPQARLTFAMARHAAVDLSQVLRTHPHQTTNRLPPADFEVLKSLDEGMLANARSEKLSELRMLYEANVQALSVYLLAPVPPWLPVDTPDAWKSTPWGVD